MKRQSLKTSAYMVSLYRGEPRTTSLILAEGTKYRHKNVIELVRRYQSDLEEFGQVAFETRLNTQGSPTEYALLNEAQFTLVATYMRNNEVVREFKKALVKEFVRMKDALLNQQNLAWQQQRLDGKAARRAETNMIARFVEYSRTQGSTAADKYFLQITKMTHAALFLVKETGPKPFRDMLDAMQAQALGMAEYIVRDALEEGMKQGIHYKDIYRLARESVERYAAAIPRQRLVLAA